MADGFQGRVSGSLERILCHFQNRFQFIVWEFGVFPRDCLVQCIKGVPRSYKLNMAIGLLLVLELVLYKTVILLPSDALLANRLRKLIHVVHSQQ